MREGRSVQFFVLCVIIGNVFARSGMLGDETDGELPPLQLKGSVEREPQDGILEAEDVQNGVNMKCIKTNEPDSTPEEDKDGKISVKDKQWKWIRFDKKEDEDDEEVPLDEVMPELNSKDATKHMTGWIRFRCKLSDEEFADFRVDAGNNTKTPKLSFKIERFEKSYYVVEKEDFTKYCKIANRTELKDGQTIKLLQEELDVSWYYWSEEEDTSFYPIPGGKPNCTR